MLFFQFVWLAMIAYLTAAFFSVLSNCICVYFVKNGFIVLDKGTLIMDIFLHNNLINMFLFSILYNIQKLRGKVQFSVISTFKGKQEIIQFLLFFFPVIASIYKTYLLGFVPVTTITISSMVVPFMVWVLAIFLLNEKLKLSYLKYGLLSVLGFVLVNLQKLSGGGWSFGYIHYLIFYIFIVSFGQITMRYYCRKRDHTLQAVMAEIMIFFIYALVLLFIRGTFSVKLLLNPLVWVISLCCFMRHVFVITGVRKASSVVALEFCGFSKPIFACILMYFLASEVPTTTKLIGMAIIAVAIVRFHALERKAKQERKGISDKLFDKNTLEKVQEQNKNIPNQE